MPEFKMVDAGKARLRVALQGDGPLVLMVHGLSLIHISEPTRPY